MTDNREILPGGITRRKFLCAGFVWIVATGSVDLFAFENSAGELTPECKETDDVTPRATAGPFYKPDSPKRTSLIESATTGTKITLTGQVFSRNCRPVPGALLDFWHADDRGAYDNRGYRLRGHQFADQHGRYFLETIVPAAYPGRTRHFHVRVQPPGGSILTTQLYFPGEPLNESDFLFNPELLMRVQDASEAKKAAFHFILPA